MWREGDEREQALRTVPGDPYLLLVPLPEVTSGINAVWGGAGEPSPTRAFSRLGLYLGLGDPHRGCFQGWGLHPWRRNGGQAGPTPQKTQGGR